MSLSKSYLNESKKSGTNQHAKIWTPDNQHTMQSQLNLNRSESSNSSGHKNEINQEKDSMMSTKCIQPILQPPGLREHLLHAKMSKLGGEAKCKAAFIAVTSKLHVHETHEATMIHTRMSKLGGEAKCKAAYIAVTSKLKLEDTVAVAAAIRHARAKYLTNQLKIKNDLKARRATMAAVSARINELYVAQPGNTIDSSPTTYSDVSLRSETNPQIAEYVSSHQKLRIPPGFEVASPEKNEKKGGGKAAGFEKAVEASKSMLQRKRISKLCLSLFSALKSNSVQRVEASLKNLYTVVVEDVHSRSTIIQEHGIELILKSLDLFDQNASIVFYSCQAYHCLLSTNKSAAKIISINDGIPILMDLLETYKENIPIIEVVLALLAIVSTVKENTFQLSIFFDKSLYKSLKKTYKNNKCIIAQCDCIHHYLLKHTK